MLTLRRTNGERARRLQRLNYTQRHRLWIGRHVTKQSNSIVHHACVGNLRRVLADLRVSRERPELLLQEPVGARQGARRAARKPTARSCAGRSPRPNASSRFPGLYRTHSELLLFQLTFAKASDKPVILMRPFGANAVLPEGDHVAVGSDRASGTAARWWTPSRRRRATKNPIAGTPSSSSSTS